MPIHQHIEHSRRPIPGGGFTLIEMIVVVVLVSVLAVIAIPRVTSFTDTRGAAAGRLIQRDMSFARERAVATGARSWVTFNTATGLCSVLVENPAAPGRAGAVVLTDPATGQAYSRRYGTGEFVGVALTGASFDAGTEVGFDWLGRPYNATENLLGASGVVTITGNHRVTIEPGTGAIAYVKP